jgi:hypothetical protein
LQYELVQDGVGSVRIKMTAWSCDLANAKTITNQDDYERDKVAKKEIANVNYGFRVSESEREEIRKFRDMLNRYTGVTVSEKTAIVYAVRESALNLSRKQKHKTDYEVGNG